MKTRATFQALCILAGAAATVPASAGTLDVVKAKGFIQCGVAPGLVGFAFPDGTNNWSGLEVDYCRAVAAAIFNDPQKVKFIPLSAKDRFTALQSGEVDLLSRSTTWTMSRDTSLGLRFAGVLYYDGQGLMVKKSLGVDSALKLDGASICTLTGTTTEMNIADYFKAHNMKYQVVAFEKSAEARKAYEEDRCDVLTNETTALYAERLQFQSPDASVVLPEIISKEPLGPVIRQGDDAWFDVVKWTYFALLNAEELGVTSKNVDKMKSSNNPEIQRLLGTKNVDGSAAGFGTGIELTDDWVVQILKHVGNYGEIFERNIGLATPLKVARGKNALWKDGGLQYAPPIR